MDKVAVAKSSKICHFLPLFITTPDFQKLNNERNKSESLIIGYFLGVIKTVTMMYCTLGYLIKVLDKITTFLHTIARTPPLKRGCTFRISKVKGVSRIWKLRGHLFRSGHLIFQEGLDSHKGNTLSWF